MSSSITRVRILALLLAGLVASAALGCGPPAKQPSFDVPDAPAEEQEAAARTAVRQDPDNAQAQFALAQLLAERGEVEDAVLRFERVLVLDPGKQRAVQRERERYARLFQDEAGLLLDQGAIDEADRRLESADRLMPEDDRTRFLQGRVAEARGDAIVAAERFRDAWVAQPRSGERRDAFVGSLMNLARDSYDRREYVAAWDLLEEASRVDPRGDFHYLKGTVAYALAQNVPEGETEEAREMHIEERLRFLDRAAEEFAIALDKNPSDEDAEFNLGAVLLAGERFEEAAELYHQLVVKHPRDGDLYLALARAQSFAGFAEEAATPHAIGRSLRIGEPVDDPIGWSQRAARRYNGSELSATYAERRSPDSIYTYALPGGSLVEVWFYSFDAVIEAFQDGRRVGPSFSLIATPYRLGDDPISRSPRRVEEEDGG